jgi:hypothetical protein
MSAAALREARLKAEMLKAKQSQFKAAPPPQPEEEEEEDEDEDEDMDPSTEYRPSGRSSNGDTAEMSAREAARMGMGLGMGQGARAPVAARGGGEEDATAWFNKFKEGA